MQESVKVGFANRIDYRYIYPNASLMTPTNVEK
jgi:hypothetical protein